MLGKPLTHRRKPMPDHQPRRVAALVSALYLAGIPAAGMGTVPVGGSRAPVTVSASSAAKAVDDRPVAGTPLSDAFAGVRMPDAAGYSTGD
jgi:hypothetical protein